MCREHTIVRFQEHVAIQDGPEQWGLVERGSQRDLLLKSAARPGKKIYVSICVLLTQTTVDGQNDNIMYGQARVVNGNNITRAVHETSTVHPDLHRLLLSRVQIGRPHIEVQAILRHDHIPSRPDTLVRGRNLWALAAKLGGIVYAIPRVRLRGGGGAPPQFTHGGLRVGDPLEDRDAVLVFGRGSLEMSIAGPDNGIGGCCVVEG